MFRQHSFASLSQLVTSSVNISQSVITSAFSEYISLEQNIAAPDLSGGYCFGFTVLALYALNLELTQMIDDKNKKRARDDWRWLKSALTRLSNWNGSETDLFKQTHSGQLLRRDTKRLINHIFHLQGDVDVEVRQQMQIHNYLLDTTGEPFIQEYTFAGIFSVDQMYKEINIYTSPKKTKKTNLLTELIQEGRLVFISVCDHVAGVIKYQNYYLLYDSNYQEGWQIFHKKQMADLATAIFETFYLDTSLHLALNFMVLSRAKDLRHTYPSPLQFLFALSPNTKIKGDDDFAPTALYMAADAGCLPAMRYFLTYSPLRLIKNYVNLSTIKGQTPLHIAASLGFVEGAKLLLEKGADPNLRDEQGKSPLHFAIHYQQLKVAKLLLDHGAIIDRFVILIADQNASENNNIKQLLLKYKNKNEGINSYSRWPSFFSRVPFYQPIGFAENPYIPAHFKMGL